jgi:DNA mismatch repair ATPase MutS
MKAFLMYRDRDFGLIEDQIPNAADLTQDLELNSLLLAMAAGDEFLRDVGKKALLASLREPEEILYRQQILIDCQQWPESVRELYTIAVEGIERERKVWGWVSDKYPDSTLHRSVEVLKIFVESLKRLRQVVDADGRKFRSEGFKRLFEMLTAELSDDYLRIVHDHLERLAFRNGTLISAELGKGNKGVNYILRKPPYKAQSWIERIQDWMEQFTSNNVAGFFYEIHERDEAGFRALSELRSQGISRVATALAQSTDHILSFFRMLRLELGFYVGCLNLRDRLVRKGEPLCLPEPLPANQPMLKSKALYDVCLSLNMEGRVVGNDVLGDHKAMVMITGANRGGKSTFLRSVGLAQLMMQCGMLVPAESFRANVCHGVFTHFKREEDSSMASGKLDEELKRMSGIVDQISPYSMALFNESFASTNEREGSEIARQIVNALLEMDVKVLYVTHMFDLAEGFYRRKMNHALFLRAERLAEGQRTFRLVAAEPLPTSYGQDLYRLVFGPAPDGTSAAGTSPP